MTEQSTSRIPQSWVTYAPTAIHEMLFVLEGKPLPDGKTMEPWKESAIKTVFTGIFPNIEAPIHQGDYQPAMLGKLLGSLLVLMTVLRPSITDPMTGPEDGFAKQLSAFALDKFVTTIASKGEQSASPSNLLSLLPSLLTQREFIGGFSIGLNSIFDNDGVTLKRDSESLLLCFLFWTHSGILRPIPGMTLTHVHKWVNEQTTTPISLANVRKVAGNIGLKFAEPGHP